MRNALDEFIIEGIPTTVAFHQRLLAHPKFCAGEYDLTFLETGFKEPIDADEQAGVPFTLKRPGEETTEEPTPSPEQVSSNPDSAADGQS